MNSNTQFADGDGQSKRKKSWWRKHITTIILSAGIVLTAAVLLHFMMNESISNLALEILAAVVAVVLVVASVAVTIHFQTDYETEREFKTELFRQQLLLYQQLLEEFSHMETDNKIEDVEIQKMKHLARSISLIASDDVIVTLSNFIKLVEEKRSLYISDEEASEVKESHVQGTFRNLVIQMREDLKVVDTERQKVMGAIAKLVKRQEIKT